MADRNAPPAAGALPRPAGDLWPIGYLALLFVGALAGGPVAPAVFVIWGALLPIAWMLGARDPAAGRIGRLAVLPLGAYGTLVLLAAAGRWDLAGAALVPLALLSLAGLLVRPDPAPAAGVWAIGLAGTVWAAGGVLGLLGLARLPAPLGSAAVPVLGAVLAYTAARRATGIQGFSDRAATSVGLTLAVTGIVLLTGGGQSVALAVGSVLGLVLATLAPAPPAARHPGLQAALQVQHELVFVAPLAFAIVWFATSRQ
ncbi:MAG TPA: hypothetical protein VKY74_18170 [Chloroflexia bacterium]|nr:hypothetical protein [Chloroflexia bacterium]